MNGWLWISSEVVEVGKREETRCFGLADGFESDGGGCGLCGLDPTGEILWRPVAVDGEVGRAAFVKLREPEVGEC